MKLIVCCFGALLIIPCCTDDGTNGNSDSGPDSDSNSEDQNGDGPCEIVTDDFETENSPDSISTYTYSESGLLDEIKKWSNYSSNVIYDYFDYDTLGNLIKWEHVGIDESSDFVDYSYGENDFVEEEHNYGDTVLSENFTHYYYLSGGKLDYTEYWTIDLADENHLIDEYFYDSQDLLTEVRGYKKGTPEIYHSDIYEYNDQGLLFGLTKYASDGSPDLFYRYEYYSNDLIKKRSVGSNGDAASGIASSYWTYTYDEEDRLSTVELYQCADDNCETGEATLRQRDTYSYDCWE